MTCLTPRVLYGPKTNRREGYDALTHDAKKGYDALTHDAKKGYDALKHDAKKGYDALKHDAKMRFDAPIMNRVRCGVAEGYYVYIFNPYSTQASTVPPQNH